MGTAHVSSASAELAGKLVRDVRPDAVFVELDAKRVSRAFPQSAQSPETSSGEGVSSEAGATGVAAASAEEGGVSQSAPAFVSTSGGASAASGAPPQRRNPFDIRARMVDAGSKAVGGAVKGMYSKLESEGFKAGDEFAMAVREGLAAGSSIVLGDRDVEVTLRRLTEAIAKTDIRQLLSTDSEMEKSMEGLLPENMKKQYEEASESGINIGGMGGIGGKEMKVDRDEFRDFVETMKARENVRSVMGSLQKAAPEIYRAMVAERDEYMAGGLDELSAKTTVAVMGMAHVDGVEATLKSRGWTEAGIGLSCAPAVR